MPEVHTVTVEDVDGVADWAAQHASAADRARILAIVVAFGGERQRQFADQPILWEIDWFYRGSETAFYRLALINSETLIELWGSS